MNYGLARNLSCRFLKFGDATLMSDKLEPKAENYVFIGYPKALGMPPTTDPKGKIYVAENGSFPENEFSRKK